MKKSLHILSCEYLAVFVLLISIITMLSGCGGQQVVQTDAVVRTDEAGQAASEEESEKTQEELEKEEAARESLEQIRAQINASKSRTEIDQETEDELTAELLEENELDTSVMKSGHSTQGCTFEVPEGFEEAEGMEGVYVTARYPLDASSIYYVAMEQDKSLQLLTEENFKEQAEEGLKEAYDEEITVSIDSFEHIKVDGYPAFRILCHYQIGRIQITQLEYAINADKSYMITYSQTNDYDRMEEYEASAATIRIN